MDDSNPGDPGNPGNPDIGVLERVAFGLLSKARQKNRTKLCMVGKAAYRIEPDGQGVCITKVDKYGTHQISLPGSKNVGLGVNLDMFVGVANDLEMAAVMDSREWEQLFLS